jgi:molybdopterin molybdotransferase
MIPFEEALATVLAAARPVETETVDVRSGLGRVLARDVASDIDMPPFDKAAMDGYACRRADLGGELVMIETVAAGSPPAKAVGRGQCSKIMTGAMVPDGADCVVMVEFTESTPAGTVRFTGEKTADNICRRGEDIGAGDAVLRKGDRIGPAEVAVLATVGCVRPEVARKVKIGVITTGDEIVEPTETPRASQIRNSNGYQLHAQAEAMGAVPRYYGIAADTAESLEAALGPALSECDVVILSGGVSMGDFDLVPGVLKASGVELLFEKIAVKPGKPTVFGTSPEALVFGLPGNPVSTFIQFETLVKPLVYRMMGHEFRPVDIMMPLGETIAMRNTSRMSWLPVATTADGVVVRLEYHGSAHSGALCGADGLISVPVGVSEIKEGTIVRVRQV